jgi:hypothetical protein
VNEVLAKVICHNLCVLILGIYELGLAPKFEASINPDVEAAKEPERPAPIADGRIVAGAVGPISSPENEQRETISEEGAAADPNQLELFSDAEEEGADGE